MTSKREKLDIFSIDDSVKSTRDEMLACAQNHARDLSLKYGWTDTEVRFSLMEPVQVGGFLRYQFEIYGVALDAMATGKAKMDSQQPEIRKSAAPPDANT